MDWPLQSLGPTIIEAVSVHVDGECKKKKKQSISGAQMDYVMLVCTQGVNVVQASGSQTVVRVPLLVLGLSSGTWEISQNFV